MTIGETIGRMIRSMTTKLMRCPACGGITEVPVHDMGAVRCRMPGSRPSGIWICGHCGKVNETERRGWR